MDKDALTSFLKNEAIFLGFENISIAKATELTEEARKLEQWLNKGYHGEMKYMENHFDKRIDPRKLVEGAKSVVSLMFNYFPSELQGDENTPKFAKYAYGEDYHNVLKDKLKNLLQKLKEKVGDINGRCFVDSAPVLERDWAKHSGLGWIGKNTLLITPQKGSYFFLAELILDVEFNYDEPIKDYCGSCRKCIDACPTNAISEKGYLMDASKCISYFTIEYRAELPAELKNDFQNWAFGCDICQDVCPWNRFSKPTQETALQPATEFLKMDKKEWLELTSEVFDLIFKKSAVKRTKFEGLKRNLKFIAE
jgi:epoxyqueuosine reductase